MSFSPWVTSSLPTGVTSSEGGYRLTASGVAAETRVVLHPVYRDSGKYALRFLVSQATGNGPGVGFSTVSTATGNYLGQSADGWAFWVDDGSANEEYIYHHFNSTALGDIASFSTEQELMIELDLDTGAAWFGVNGVWNGGDPAAGTGALVTNVNTAVQLAVDLYYDSSVKLLQPGEFDTPATAGFTAGWPDPGPVEAYVNVPSPLAVPSASVNVPLSGALSAASVLGAPGAFVLNDWTATVPRSAQIYYYAELRGIETVRLPISSWQATLQVGRESYLQCVVPAAENYIDDIAAAGLGSQLAVIRGALFPEGERRELDMATVPLKQMPYQRGPQRSTVTLSGYGDITFSAVDASAPPAGSIRPLSGVQTLSTQGGVRVRCELDWLIRPGLLAEVDGIQFPVSYINFYVNPAQTFMDVGERSL